MANLLNSVLLFMDAPDHTRLRGLVSRAFTPRSVERLRPRMAEIVDDLVAAALERGSMDLIADFAFPLPITVICELLGVPVEDRDLFRTRTPQLAAVLEGVLPADKMEQAATAAMEFAAYLLPLFEERRREPRDDLISALVAAEDQGDRLSHEELLTTTMLLLGAGHETTTNLVGNGMLALLGHPDQLDRLRRDPTMVRGAVEELLRYDSPVQLTARNIAGEMDLAGRRFHKGEQVVVLLGAANRDPAAHPEPEVLDVGRAEVHHLSFSHGAHFCLGAALARAEAEIALTALVTRFPGLRLGAEPPRRRPTRTLRGLLSLPLAWDGS
jgi:cytochrome P450